MSEVLKVSSKSSPNAVAGALAAVVRQEGEGEIQVVGAGALNQAVKAIAIARGFLTDSGVDLVCVPTFADIEIEGEERTAIRLTCEDRSVTRAAARIRSGHPSTPPLDEPYTVDLRVVEGVGPDRGGEAKGAVIAAGGAASRRP